jgi:hypothetical protein
MPRHRDPAGYIELTPGVVWAWGGGYCVAFVVAFAVGVAATLLLHTPQIGRAPDAGAVAAGAACPTVAPEVVASIAAGEEARRGKSKREIEDEKRQRREEEKERKRRQREDGTPKREKNPLVDGEAQQMAGEPESQLCGPGDGREIEGCGP